MDVDALLAWYDAGHRDLPWRRTRDPYRLLVAEVMLQQTQAARVVPYYERFLATFADERALAAAPAPEVLRAWSGLGYNRRALALRAAASHVVEHGWPRDAAGLRALPGVGPYTAAAVAAFAWGERVAALDTNVRRLLTRWDGVARPARELAARADALVPAGRAADFNQATMELGAIVCTARAPRCAACPVRPGCATAGGGADPAVPVRRPRRERFEDTDRYARGRVLAALVASGSLPALDPDRLERALTGLERDGLVERDAGSVRLPRR